MRQKWERWKLLFLYEEDTPISCQQAIVTSLQKIIRDQVSRLLDIRAI